jgi:hypothetical protein
MRWKTETYAEQKKRLEAWKPWFAWYPIMIDNERVWLEWVYRRNRVYNSSIADTEYADALSILKKQKNEREYDGLE